MYFVIEITESYLNLAWFVLWNHYTPSEAWLPNGKNEMCLHCLQMVSPSLRVQLLTSEWSEDFSHEDRLGHLAGRPRGRAERSPEADVHVYCSRAGISHLGTYKRRIASDESPQLWSWAGGWKWAFQGQLPNWRWAKMSLPGAIAHWRWAFRTQR